MNRRTKEVSVDVVPSVDANTEIKRFSGQIRCFGNPPCVICYMLRRTTSINSCYEYASISWKRTRINEIDFSIEELNVLSQRSAFVAELFSFVIWVYISSLIIAYKVWNFQCIHTSLMKCELSKWSNVYVPISSIFYSSRFF